jgi:electron transfer flavoprotein alpha subunit
MGKLVINYERLNPGIIKKLIKICPFDAIEVKKGRLEINSACKMCKICVKKGPPGIIEFIEDSRPKIKKNDWKGVAVYVDHVASEIHPVTYELLGKAIEIAKKINHPVYALFMGEGVLKKAAGLLHYGVDEIFAYDYPQLKDFRIEPYTAVFEDFINKVKPSIILVGATTTGRSLAPRVAARFKTGLTADCTVLDVRKNTDLVQIRPAFGGNIMAKIITARHRPQFATVRYKVMDAPPRKEDPHGKITRCRIKESKLDSGIDVIKVTQKEKEENITEADIIIASGKAFKNQKELSMAEELAEILGGVVAGTRPMIESGLIDPRKQIGLSGRTVKPKLIINLGISGSVQYAAGMKNSGIIFSINKDPSAPIFNISHYSIVGDIFEIVPELLKEIKKYKDRGIGDSVMAGVS